MKGVIGTDCACGCCGYNLRTLARAGDCPECGTPISLALSHRAWTGATQPSDHLDGYDRWVRRQRHAALLALTGGVIAFSIPYLSRDAIELRGGLGGVAWFIGAAALWTCARPPSMAEAKTRTVRTVMHVIASMLVACVIIMILPGFGFRGFDLRMSDPQQFATTFGTFPVPGAGFTALPTDLFQYNSRRGLAAFSLYVEEKVQDGLIFGLLISWSILFPLRIAADLRLASNRVGPARRDGFVLRSG